MALDISPYKFSSVFYYDDSQGALYWKIRPEESFASIRAARTWNSRFGNKPSGSKRSDGYFGVKFEGREYLTHRIIWVLNKGSIPAGLEVDHIDRDRSNSKIQNLRLVTRSGNQKNAPMRKDNKSGVRGLHWHSAASKWCIQIYSEKKCVTREYYSDFDEAKNRIAERRKALNFTETHGI